jgi:mannan endo-1,4-beta-mannosidase
VHQLNKLYLFFTAFFVINSAVPAQNSFVQQQDRQFYCNGQPYRFAGANMWYAALLAMQNNKGGNRQRLQKELDFLKQNGITNIRVLIGSQDGTKKINGVLPVHPALQTGKDNYNNDVFEGMDFLLQQLEKRKLYAVFYFANNWEWSGGFLQYLNWNNKIDDSTLAKKFSWDEYRDIGAQFYNCTPCKEDYFSFVKTVLNRTNTITKQKYTVSPAVMAWEIANEPRPMRIHAADAYIQFIKEAAALIKSHDRNHMVTTGVEGYMGTENSSIFKQIHNDTNVDYATIHIWPKNWSWFKDSSFVNDFAAVIQKTKQYIEAHTAILQELNKPLVLEEFGLPRDAFSFSPQSTTTYRDRYFESVLQTLLENKKAKGALAGINFWAYGGFGKPAKNATPFWKEGDDLLGDPPMEEQGLNAVFSSDSSTWRIIKKYAALLNK